MISSAEQRAAPTGSPCVAFGGQTRQLQLLLYIHDLALKAPRRTAWRARDGTECTLGEFSGTESAGKIESEQPMGPASLQRYRPIGATSVHFILCTDHYGGTLSAEKNLAELTCWLVRSGLAVDPTAPQTPPGTLDRVSLRFVPHICRPLRRVIFIELTWATAAVGRIEDLAGKSTARPGLEWRGSRCCCAGEVLSQSVFGAKVTRHSIGLPSAVSVMRSSFITSAPTTIPRCDATSLVAGQC